MSIRTCLHTLVGLVVVFFAGTALAEEIRDYYAEPGINPFKETLNENFNEHIDPFSGTLQLKYTDIHVPGNGGMDINVTRTYTSLQTNDYPKLGRNGLGWTMHFGRIVASSTHQANICNQAAFPLTTKENPSLELPDGGRELLVLSRNHTDGTLVTRSNWRAQCTTGIGMLVTAPNGTRYFMDRFDIVEDEPSWLTTRIEDVHGNWIAIDYARNAVGISYITQIRRSEDGVVVTFEYEDLDTAGIVVSAIHSNNQTWHYEYETIPGFLFDFYKQLKRVIRPDGTMWVYDYNPKLGDPDPNDDLIEDGIASYSLIRVTYPHGAQIEYTYQYVQFDPGASPTFQRTTAIATKQVSGSGVTNGTWTYSFAPFSAPFTDSNGRPGRYDVTTITAPEAIYRYAHLGKDFSYSDEHGFIFIRPSYVGTQVWKETWTRGLSSRLIERRVSSWTLRKISEEDFWHGAGYRDWWRDDGTYVPVLTGEFVTRDSHAASGQARHARRYYEHDEFGNPGRVVDHSNIGEIPSRQVRYTYFNDTTKWILGLPLVETHEAGEGDSATTLGTVEREYDANGLLLRVVDFGEETRYTYTAQGDVKTQRDARGNITRFDDYKRGIAQLEERPESVTIHRIVNNTGTLRSETNGRGFITRFTYDDLNRLTSIDYPIGADVTIRYENGFGVSRRVLTRGNYRQTEHINDFGEIVRMEREDLATGQSIVRTSEYDAHGRRLFESYPNATIGTRSTYDALGRVLRITHPDDAFVAYEYDDEEVTVRDERNFPTRYVHFVPGIAFESQEPVTIDEPENVTTVIHRDVWGNPIRVVQGERRSDGLIYGYSKTYRYNERRLLVEAVEPEIGTTTFDHDEVGNVTSERVNNLRAVTFRYDGLNRRTRVDFPDDTPDVVTQYDANGNPERVTKGTTEWVYTYDQNDNLLTETLTINHPLFAPRVYGLVHAYSNLDVRSQTTYPSGLAVTYDPDAFGRATKVGSFATNVTYHPSGQVQSYTLANGVTTNVALNQRLMTQSISAPGVVSLSYGYDPTGNVLQITDGIDSSKNVLMNNSSYDGLNRLLNGTGKWGASSFTYDHTGNIRNRNIGTRGLRYDLDSTRRVRVVERFNPSTPNTLTGVLLYDYDPRGNARSKRQYSYTGSFVSSIDDKRFDFDSASQLIRARVTQTTDAGETVIATKDYVYDGNGQRAVEQKHGTYDIRFSVYGRDGQLVFEDSISECTRTDYVRLGALSIARSDDRPAAPSLDTDGDDIPDCLETQLGLDPNNAADAAADNDSDGVSNLDEIRAGTSLVRADTDGDGLSDFNELTRDLTDPTSTDTDADGLSDTVEASNPALDPSSSDSDHDGVSDYWEVQLATNPEDPGDGLLDSDGDGYSNRQESQAGSDPQAAGATPARGTRLWSNDSLGRFASDVVIGRDRSLYVVGDDGKVHAFYPDGRRRWTFQPAFNAVRAPTIGPDGTVYIVSRLNGGAPVGAPMSSLEALSPDGTLRWSSDTTDLLETAAAVGLGNRLYIGGIRVTQSGTGSSLITAFDASNGARLVTRLIQSTPDETPGVSFHGEVFVGTYAGHFYAFSETLEPLWTYSMRSGVASAASIGADGTVYAGDNSGWVYAWNRDGTLRWEQRVSQQGPQYSAVTIGDNGVLYVGGFESRLHALNASDGSTLWSVNTTGTVFTPALAANGTVYATTYGGDLMAFDPAGALLWRVDTGTNVNAAPVLDRDGTIYFGTVLGQLYAVADNGGGPARTPWPMRRHDSAATSYTCFNEPAFSVVADADGDRIDDCAELRYGLDPADAADGALDSDNDGLLNWEEHEHGTRLDVADTDGDGLNDGLEVLTYHTNPAQADSDHDTIPDGVEVQVGTNPLVSDAHIDSDGDGFSNRQESWAGTDLLDASSAPVVGQVLRQETGSFGQKYVAVARDGTIYQNSENGLEALNPDLTRKWNWPTPIVGSPIIGRDGTIYVSTARVNQQHRLVALLPNGAVRWSVTFQVTPNNLGLYDSPALGPNGVVHVVETTNDSQGDLLHAFDSNGVPLTSWGGGHPARVFARRPAIAVAANGDVVVWDSLNALSMRRGTNGTQLWRNTDSATYGGSMLGMLIGPDGRIYLSRGSSIVAVNPANGQRLWTANSVSGVPLIDSDNRLIASCTSPSGLCAIDPATGAVVWTSTVGYSYVGAPVIDAEGSILSLTGNNRFVALNADGTLRWETPLSGNPAANGPVVLEDGTIYIGASGTRLLIAGSGRGLGDSWWPARHRDQKNSRSAADMSDVEPSQAPLLTITSPSAQTTLRVDVGQAISAKAVASDFQDGALSPAIQWTSNLSGFLGSGPELPLGGLAIGTHTITATVTDSDGNTATASRTIEVGVFPPELTIYDPQDGYTYDQGQAVYFYAVARDVMDGDISANVHWSSSLDGEIGVGQSFSRTNLSIGTHLITARSTDSTGVETTASVTISIQAVPPTLEIYSPGDMEELEYGLPANFYAYAWDGSDGDLGDSIHWSSDLEGELGVGRDIAVSNLRLGTHVITATVTDSSGASASASRTVVIRHLPPDLWVYSPWYYEEVWDGDSVQFEAHASDLVDGDLTSAIQWSSSLEGSLGTGGFFTRSDLSVGMHLVTASITDSHGQTRSEQRYVVVRSDTNTAPFVSISAPAAGAQVYVNDPVTMTATAFDTQDGLLSSSIQWSSNIDGPLGTGASLTVSTLSVGTHTLRAFVQDSSNGKGAATVQITVLPIPADYPPTIRFTSIGVGARYTADSAFSISAVASDREDGDISSRLEWSSSIDGPLGTGDTVYVSGLTAGVHDITARVVDDYGNIVTATRSIEIFADGDAMLLDDDFSVVVGPDALAGWEKFDDGTQFPSAWVLTGGALAEFGNAQAGSTAAAAIEKPGTYMRQTTGMNWLDYRLEATLRSTDNDGIGLMFRYTDNNNYYRFSMDSERSFRRLVKKENGVYSLLWQDSVPYVVNQSYEVAITAEGSNITLAIDGVELWSGTDTSHRRGTIALYAWSESAAYFDNVRVTNLRTADSNDPPALTITSPANNSSVYVGNVVTLSGTALDFEDGNVSSNIAWTSSLDGALGTGTTLNVSTLQIGSHVITARVTDSDGVTSAATVNLTVEPPFNEPPTLSVTSPAEGATFNVGTNVSFAGTANDVEDGSLGNGIAWTSNRDGLLGTGASFTVSTLSPGIHTITASITDSGGKTATVTRTITVVVPGNTSPVVTLSAPLSGSAFEVGQAVTLSAMATDAEDGSLTGQIAWSSSIDGPLGTGGSFNVSTLSSGAHVITAMVEDSMGGSHSRTANVTVVPTAAILLRDDFSDNNYNGWTVTDEGTISAPSAWSAATGALRQTSNIYSNPTTAATIPKPGTYIRYTAGTSWTNYSVTVELTSSDDDVLGVMFRYTNNNSYYRFSMDSERSNRRLSKKRLGTWTTLWSDSTAFQLNRTYVLEIVANGSNITVKLDGVQLWSGNDTQALTSGTIAMYSWNNTGAQFDNVLVRNLAVPSSTTTPNLAPPVNGLDSRVLLAERVPKPVRLPREVPDFIAPPIGGAREARFSLFERDPIHLVMVLPRPDVLRVAGSTGSLQ